jgi:signal transduction histidine kinase
LLPEARLEPVRDGEDDAARRLAALPLRLIPGRPAVAAPVAIPGLLLPLTIAWVLAGLSLAAAGALLWGMATLGERRAAFVSAVTHELRTPLTTFRMYAEMLAEGMVRGEPQQREYLETLRREADRQSHLVENVLAYSRLERGRHRAARETASVASLLSPLTGALAAQAERTGMSFVAPEEGPWASMLVRVDRSAVERILFNLVDNACKYARDATDRRIHLECQVEERAVRLCVADHGPGLTTRDARQLFRPFRKSARDAAQSAPGVGLGLALSRRLARATGGDLFLAPSAGDGARFCLHLPRA